MNNVKKPIYAGSFYPKDKKELFSSLSQFVGTNPQCNKNIKAIIVPHAGYIYSGEVAGKVYSQLLGKDYSNVFLMGCSHNIFMDYVAVASYEEYATPLGNIPQSKEINDLIDNDYLKYDNNPHEEEHSLEVQLPFLQYVLKDFAVTMMLVGFVDLDYVAEEFSRHVGDQDLVVVSSDLSHYYDYETAMKLDNETMKKIVDMDVEYFKRKDVEACGSNAIALLLKIAKLRGWKPEIIEYKNSGDTAGDKNKVVGYGGINFYE